MGWDLIHVDCSCHISTQSLTESNKGRAFTLVAARTRLRKMPVSTKKYTPSKRRSAAVQGSGNRISDARVPTKAGNPTKDKKTAPLPPTGKCTVKHLATQLEGQMARSSGYVPRGGVLLAFHAHHQRPRKGIVLQPTSRGRFMVGRCFGGRKKKKKPSPSSSPPSKKMAPEMSVRLLDESEW